MNLHCFHRTAFGWVILAAHRSGRTSTLTLAQRRCWHLTGPVLINDKLAMLGQFLRHIVEVLLIAKQVLLLLRLIRRGKMLFRIADLWRRLLLLRHSGRRHELRLLIELLLGCGLL